MFDLGCVKQSVVDRRADPRIGRGVEFLFVGECRGLPVTQPLSLRYALPQHDGREFAQALLPDAPLGGYRLQVDEPCVAEMAYLAQRYAGNTTMPYAQWLEEVDDIDVETPTAENPTV